LGDGHTTNLSLHLGQGWKVPPILALADCWTVRGNERLSWFRRDDNYDVPVRSGVRGAGQPEAMVQPLSVADTGKVCQRVGSAELPIPPDNFVVDGGHGDGNHRVLVGP
jgi:hypothetical protein